MTSAANTRPSRLTGPSLLHQLVSTTPAAGGPAIDALLSDGSQTKLSYEELHVAADTLSKKLLRRLPRPGPKDQTVIPVLVPQSPELYVSLLAILKAGAAFCTLNLDAPAERVKFIIGDVDAKVLITTSDLVDRIPAGLDLEVVVLGRDDNGGSDAATACTVVGTVAAADDPIPIASTTENGLAYVMYTSGSTGTPKGVAVSHGAVTQSLLAHDKHIPSFSRFLQFAAPTFDVSVFEIFFPFFRGATLVSCCRAEMLNDLPAVLRTLRVDACELTPTVAGSLLRSRENAPCLKLLLTIGEMLSEPVIREFGGTPDRPSILWAMYGPTEAAIHCTLAPAMSADSPTGHIGIPLDTVSCFVVSRDYKPEDASTFEVLPIGEVGELVVGGYQTAAGYLNRPEQTAQVFVNSPLGPVYRTGDLARMNEGGSFECLGRMAEGQVKLRGQRIELGEVEQAALRTPGCHSAVAAVVSHILVVFCAVDSVDSGDPGAERDLQREAIREKCSAWLPSFMVPRDIVLMTEFPRLASGKVDRKKLTAEYEKPSRFWGEENGDMEESDDSDDNVFVRVRTIANRLTGADLKRNTDLASSGLDSLAAIKLASLIRKDLDDGVGVSAAEVLKSRTLSDLCSVITQKRIVSRCITGSAEEPAPPTVLQPDFNLLAARNKVLQPIQGEVASILPCTPLQFSMLSETLRNPRAYCNEISLRFSEQYGAAQVLAAFRQVIQKNEILRTGFIYDEERFLQVVFKGCGDSRASIVSQFTENFHLSDEASLLTPLRFQVLDTCGSDGRLALLHIHHGVYDGWSMDMILSDLDTFLRGGVLEPRPQFSDVASFYDRQAKTSFEESKVFWAEHLLGWEKSPMPKLCGKAEKENHVLSWTRRLQAKPDDVAAVAKSLTCSPQVVFQAALVWLWSGIVGNADTVIGSVTSGRTISLPDIERTMGPCIASMPLRVDLSSVAKIDDLLSLIHASNRAIIQHAGVPFADIKRLAKVSAGDRLYDVLFVYQESLDSKCHPEGSVRQASHLDILETPLLVEVEPLAGGFACQATYHSSAFPQDLVEILLRQFDRVVQAILGDPSTRLEAIRESFGFDLLSIHNPHVKNHAGCKDLASVVEETAAKMPDKLALHLALSISDGSGSLINGETEAEMLSFRELNGLANKIARWILTFDVGTQGSPIIIMMEKSALLYASILGILKTARAYLPLLPTTPIARTQAIVEQAKVSVCITDTATSRKLEGLRSCCVLDAQAAPLADISDGNLCMPTDANLPAYVIYTSGTTGLPKGVVVTQQNIVSNLETLRHIYPVGDGSRLLQACSQAFDVSVFEIFFTWMTGMCLCTASNDVLFEDLERAIRTLGITHLSMTPTVAALVRREAVPRVEFLVTAGEAMTQAVFDEWKGVLYQGYGPSETTNICTVKKMGHGDHVPHLGHVFENTSAFVLYIDSLTPVPMGAVGELCFGGDQVAQGYLNDPALTATKFVTMPNFGTVYRSGDLGRMLDDGSLLILGRIDDQVKLRGQRIDVGEIESIVAGSQRVASSVATTVSRGPESSKQLAVFYSPHDACVSYSDFRILAAEEHLEIQQALFAALESALPSYMVPSYLVPVSCAPRTVSGKIDRRTLGSAFQQLSQEALEKLSFAAGTHAGVDAAEWSAEERRVAHCICSSLRVPSESLGRWTPLAAVGLDSISAISVAKSLSQALGRRVAVSAILQNPTVAQFTARVAAGRGVEKQAPQAPAPGLSWFSETFTSSVKHQFRESGLDVEAVLPCTPLQEAMLASKAGGGAYYNRMLLRLRASPGEMRSYWETMCARHEILRTCFMSTEDPRRPFAQVVLRRSIPPWDTPGNRYASAKECLDDMEKAAGEPVNSKRPPVAFSVAFQDGLPFLCFLCHHAVYDGVAMSRLLHEVEELAAGGHALPTPIPYDAFLRESLVLPSSTQEFWAGQLKSFRPIGFSRAQERRGGTSEKTHTCKVDVSLTAVEERARSLGLSLLSICQAAWANTLAIALDTEDICFGNVVSGRTLVLDGIDRLVAPCFNTIPLRIDISAHKQVIDVLRAMQRLNPDLMMHQFTPLRFVQKVVNSHDLFDTLLLLQPPKIPLNQDIWELVSDDGGMDVSLVCEITPDPLFDGISTSLRYDETCFPRQFIAAMGDSMNRILKFSLQFPFSNIRRLGDLPEHAQQAIRLVPARRQDHRGVGIRPDGDNNTGDGAWSDVETRTRRVLSRLSGIPEAGIKKQTTIFQLGLDSINAVQIASILQDQGVNVTALDVLAHPTCEKLSTRLQEKSDTFPDERPTRIDFHEFQGRVAPFVRGISKNFDRVLPCTPVQIAMLTEFVRSRGQNYFNYLHLVLTSEVPLPEMVAAWQAVSSAHAMLRTGFVAIDDDGGCGGGDDAGKNLDTSYVMLRYGPDDMVSPISTMSGPQTSQFDVAKWRLDTRRRVLKALHEPPWRAILLENEGGVSMHILLHHAIYDAASLEMILRDLARCMAGGKVYDPVSVELALGAMLQRTSKQNQTAAEAFWKSQATKAVVNRFPVMTPLRVEQGELLSETLTSSLSMKELQHAAQEANVSVQAALQAAWTRVLSSYLGEDAVVFGTVMSGRDAHETQNAVFPCITTVPVVARNVTSNSELLKTMMEFSKDLHAHQFSRLADIQRWVGHPGTRLFDTLLVYQRRRATVDARISLPWTVARDDGFVDFPVSLEIEPVKGSIELRTTFRSEILPQEQAAILLAQFDGALRHLVLDPHGDEGGLWPRLPNLFSVVRAMKEEIPSEVKLLHQLVELQASRQPDKVALEFVSGFQGASPIVQRWSFAELDRIGDRVARHLGFDHAIPVGSIVAMHFDKCPEAYFSILGILKAGCCFLALDPAAPEARKAFILQDSQAAAVLAGRAGDLSFVPGVPVLEITRDCWSLDQPDQCDQSEQTEEQWERRQISPADPCYCLYTSGTTGIPKGCEITHENSIQAMMAFQGLFRGHWDQDSKWLQFASLHFDVSVLEQYWSWSVGMTVVAAPRDLILDDIESSIRSLGITHIDLTPSLASLVRPEKVPSLWKGVFITGGEQLKQDILDAWGPKGVIYNAYGPTEATIGVTMRQRVPATGRPVNIGRQFANVGTYVFGQGTEVPVLKGGVGELCISGKLVGKGYLNRPELTAERFPTLAEFGERAYRTGDLVRILHDGSFDFLGRADDQVKLRGQRLQLGEVNHAIRSGVPTVRDAATVVAKHAKTGKDLLVSFIVSNKAEREGQSRGPLEVSQTPESARRCRDARVACSRKVPSYMVPTYILELPYIPLSRNNKAEGKELKRLFEGLSPELLLAHASAPRDDRNGSGSVNRRGIHAAAHGLAAQVIAEFCGLGGGGAEELSAEMSIFELGVDSISVPRLARSLKKRGVQGASVEVLLRNPILGDLFHTLSRRVPAQSAKNSIAEANQTIRACGHRYRALACRELGLTMDHLEYVVPCTPIQQGMISRALAGEREQGEQGAAYFNAFSLALREGTVVARLKEAWERTISLNGILRTRFAATPEGFVQVCLRQSALDWKEFDETVHGLATFHADRLRSEWIEANSAHIAAPLQFILVVRRDGSVSLKVHIFHALYDGISLDLILQSVAALYRSGVPGACKPLDSGPSFADTLALGPLWKYDHCKGFWSEHLRNWKPVSIPQLCHTPSSGSGDRGDASARTLFHGGHLEAIQRCLGVTMQSVILALWTATLRRTCGEAATTGVITSGRAIDVEGIEKTIGPLFSTVPFLAPQQADDETWSSLIRACHEFSAAISSFQHVPLRDVQRWCSVGKPLFDNLFAFQVEAQDAQDCHELWEMEDEPPRADYPLAFEATLKASGDLEVLVLASGQIADDEGLRLVLQHFRDNVESLISNQEERIHIHTPRHSRSEEGQNSLPLPTAGPALRSAGSMLFPQNLAIGPRTFLDEISSHCQLPVKDLEAGLSLANLGLDSIDVVRLSARLKSLGITLTTREMTGGQYLGNIVELLQNGDSKLHGPPSEDRVSSSSFSDSTSSHYEVLKSKLGKAIQDEHLLSRAADILPSTALQETMMSQMLQSECRQYFNHDLLEISDDVDAERLMAAWTRVYLQNPILRTVFIDIADPNLDVSFCQVVLNDSVPCCITRTVLAEMPEIDHVIEKARSNAAMGNGRSNLFQLCFLVVGARRFVLLSIAHALYDGWSLALLHQDVEAAYHGRKIERPAPGPYLGSLAAATSNDEASRFWAQYLADAEPTVVPPRHNISTPEEPENLHRLELVSNIAALDATSFAKKHGISMQVLGQACWAAVLGTLASSLDLTFGLVLSGRDFEDAEKLMFPTMNTVAVRCILHGTAVDFLHYMEENMANIRGAQSYPLRKAQIAAKGRPFQLLNTLFLFQKSPISLNATQENQNREPLMRSVETSSAVEYPICVELEVMGDDLVWRTACKDSHLDSNDARRLLHQLDQAFEFLLHHAKEELLCFEEEGEEEVSGGSRVSICGLPSILLYGEDGGIVHPCTNEENTNDEPWTQTEEAVRDILGQISGISPLEIRKSATLYNLGLDSISAIKVAARLRQKDISLSIRQLLTAGSIFNMAEMASGQADDDNAPPEIQPDPVEYHSLGSSKKDEICRAADVEVFEIDGILPALPMQVYMMTAWQNSQGSIFFPHFYYQLAAGSLQENTIRVAWAKLVTESPILRTCFVATGKEDGLSLPPLLQLVLTPNSRGAKRRARLRSAGEHGDGVVPVLETHDLVQLFATRQDSESSWLLVLRIHHALYDAVSLSALMGKLVANLCSETVQEAKPTPTPTPKPQDGERLWNSFIARHVSPDAHTRRRQFWTKYLCDCDSSQEEIPTPDLAMLMLRTSVFVPSAAPDIARIRSACAEQGISFQALFFAAYGTLLASQRRQGSRVGPVVFGIYLANRSLQPSLPAQYPTLNLVPLKVDVHPGSGLFQRADQVQKDLHAIAEEPNSTVGLWEIEAWTGVRIDVFVNFLAKEDNPATAMLGDEVSLMPVEDQGGEDQGQGVRDAAPAFTVPSWLKENSVARCYPPSIDIEASVTGNILSIGVFGPRDRISTQEAQSLVDSLVEVLQQSSH